MLAEGVSTLRAGWLFRSLSPLEATSVALAGNTLATCASEAQARIVL